MITDIHEKIKEEIREAIHQPNSASIIADFMNYSLPYRLEKGNTDKYSNEYPWGKIAQKIKEDPNVLKSQEMAYAISASFRSSTKFYAQDEFSFAFDIMEKLKTLKDDKIITEEQFQETLNLQSPETGETLLTRTMKEVLNITRGMCTMAKLHRLFEIGVDVNIPNAKEQYPIQIAKYYYNLRRKKLEYNIKNGLVNKEYINEEYTFPDERKILEEKTSKEIKEQIKQNISQEKVGNIKCKSTKKIRAYVSDDDDISEWQKTRSQGYAYAINVIETTYLTVDSWGIDTLILPGKYIVYEGSNIEQQVIELEKFYNQSKYFYLIEMDGKKIKPIEGKEVLKAIAGKKTDKVLTGPDIIKISNNVTKKIDEKIDVTKIKVGIKQLERASDNVLKKITKKLFKK